VAAEAAQRRRVLFPVIEDPRGEEDLTYDCMLERFREVRDEIESKIKCWLEHPELELNKLSEERERRERLAVARREADDRAQQWPSQGEIARLLLAKCGVPLGFLQQGVEPREEPWPVGEDGAARRGLPRRDLC
jgi:hypothetical protein